VEICGIYHKETIGILISKTEQTANYVNHVHYTVLYYTLKELNLSYVTLTIIIFQFLTTTVCFAIPL